MQAFAFSKNIDRDLSENDMNLDDHFLFNFIDASSQLMRDDGITPWRGPRQKHPLFYQVLIDVLSKSEHIVADLSTSTCINIFFCLEIILNFISQIKTLSFVVLSIIVYCLFDRALHTSLPRFETSPLSIGRC